MGGEIESRGSRKNGVPEVVVEEAEAETGCLQDVDLLQETEIEEMQVLGDVEVVAEMMDLLPDVMIDHHREEMIEEAEDATSALEAAEDVTLVIETEEMEAETLVETEIAEMMDLGDVVEAEVREILVIDLV